MKKINKCPKTPSNCQCSSEWQCQDNVKRPSDYVKDGTGYNHIRHFMKSEYLNEGHNTSGEGGGITGAIRDPVIDATVDALALRECLKELAEE